MPSKEGQQLVSGRGKLLIILAVKVNREKRLPVDLALFELDDPEAVVAEFASQHSTRPPPGYCASGCRRLILVGAGRFVRATSS